MAQRTPPGPIGTSCLTCKRRHKKCDQRRPVCERCEKVGYECLGYGHNRNGVARPILGTERRVSDSSVCRTEPVHIQPKSGCQSVQGHDPKGGPSTQGYSEDTNAPTSSSFDSFVSLEIYFSELVSSASDRNGDSIRRDPVIPVLKNSLPAFATNLVANHHTSPPPFLPQLFAFYTQIPYSPPDQPKALLNGCGVNEYVLSCCERKLEYSYFKPFENQIRQVFLSGLNASSFTRWIMVLSTRVYESLADGDTSQNQIYDQWIENIDHALRSALICNPGSHQIQRWLCDWLQVLLLRTRVVHTSMTYKALKSATPAFLQLVFSNPTLWPANCDLTSIPLANMLTSPRHELSYFALMDSICAMVFGLSQQVEYDTSFDRLPPNSNFHEWLHSSPAEFQIRLAEINACRDKSPIARNWREIEHRLVTWQAQASRQAPEWESWVVVAWLAVQESWRHTLLTYLYMAVCGASSDDPRVQPSVCQIFRVIETVKKQGSSKLKISLFLQYLMAGICARSEKHRRLARDQLANVTETRLWLMRGVDFVPVLDHLWHGAAANGQPITWNDYMQSREIMLPIAL